MGSNKFNRALGHLKSTSIDEKIRLLDEQPTNNTTQIYIDEPDTIKTITLNPNLNPLDLTQDADTNGRDTSGLFMPDGTILTEEPPGDTSYILGPMAAMYYTWSYPWTMIGYIRQSDRRMVNLGRIDGKLSDWDGSVGNAGSGTGTFSSYGQLTTEQALWFRDIQKQPGATNDPSTYNYYAFYPGPPSQFPDSYGRYPCAVTGVSKNRSSTTGTPATDRAKGINPEWGLSGYMFVKNEKTGEWEKKYYYNDGTTSSERSGEMTPDNPFYDAYQRGGGDQAAENGYSRDEIIRNGNEQIQREIAQQAQQDYQDTLRKMSDKPMTIDDFKSAADYSAYKNGGGDAARAQGKSVEDIIRQGIENIDAYDGGSRNPTPVNPDGTPYVPNVNPNIASRVFRSATDQIRYGGGDVMYQGNPAGRAPGLSNYWSPDPSTAAGYSNPGGGYAGARPNPTGTLTTAPKPPNTPRVTRSPLGQPQFKFPKGSPPPAGMITQVADDAAVSVARRAGARTAGKTLGRLVPGVSIGISLADAGYRAANGDYLGALFSGVSAVPGPIGWLGLGLQLGGDALGATGVKEQAESYDDYLKTARETVKNNGVKIDRNAMLAEILYTIAQSDQLDDEDKKFFVAILTQADGLQPDDVKSFVQKIQQKLMGKKVSESSEHSRKRILREIKNEVVLPDEKKEKLKGYRPKTFGKLHAQYDKLMQKAENPASFKQMDETAWTKQDKYYNARLSQERKNEVLDHIGTSDHYWDILTETGRKRSEKGLKEKYGDFTLVRKEQMVGDTLLFLVDEHGKKETVLQSEYSDRIARQMEEPLWEQETLNAPNDPLIKRVKNKLATQIDYPDKPSRMGYPDGPTPQQVAGWHPEYGKRSAYYNALDPQSADSMPATGDPETDQKVAAQKTPLIKKTKKELKAEARLIQSDWKNEIQIPEKKLEEEVPKFRKLLDVTKERGVVSEKMTSSAMFVNRLEPTGDDINVDISTSSLRYNINNSVVADGAIRFGEVEPGGYSSSRWYQSAGTDYMKTTTVDGEKQNTHVSFNVDVGTGIDAPLPNHPLVVQYQMVYRDANGNAFNAGTGTLGNITSSGIHSFELPEFHEYFEISFDLSVDGTYLQQYEAAYQRRQFVGTTFYGMTITEDDTIASLGPARMLRIILDHPGPYDSSASSSMHVFLGHTRTNGQTVYQSLNTMPSGETGGHTGADREYLYNLIRSQYAHLKDRYAKTYTINSLGMTRRTPIAVFTALDDPDSSSFIRMNGLENLSAEERRKRLAEMLAAGDEYMRKYLGMDPTTARPDGVQAQHLPTDARDYTDQDDPILDGDFPDDPFDDSDFPDLDIPLASADWPKGRPGKGEPPVYAPWNKGWPSAPGGRDYEGPPGTPGGKYPMAKKDGTEIAAGGNPRNTGGSSSGDPNNIQWPRNKYPNKKAPPGPGYRPPTAKKKQETQVAHHELEGDVISEKKRLKNPEELLNKIPGYYDGKPAPLGFPVEPPAKIINGFHADLVTPKGQEKQSNRYNRMDQATAKATPMTGNPYIDKKVLKARNQPK